MLFAIQGSHFVSSKSLAISSCLTTVKLTEVYDKQCRPEGPRSHRLGTNVCGFLLRLLPYIYRYCPPSELAEIASLQPSTAVLYLRGK